jgi:hypothetical protein
LCPANGYGRDIKGPEGPAISFSLDGLLVAFGIIADSSAGGTSSSGFSNKSSVSTLRRAGGGEDGNPTAAITCSIPSNAGE